MSENYIVINGKKIIVTEKQVELLGFKIDNPFMRVAENDRYFCIEFNGAIMPLEDYGGDFDNRRYDNVNYFNDKAFAKQVALHQLLYRKLLKFAYEQGYEDVAEWNCCNLHYRIHYTYGDNKFDVASNDIYKNQGAVYFATRNGAECAIKEVVEPFMKEHPEFVW